MFWIRRLALLLLTVAPALAAAPLAIEAVVQDGWPALDGPGGPAGSIKRGQLRRVEVTLTNDGDDVVVLQSVTPEAGLTSWFEMPFGSVTRTGDRATLDRSNRNHSHGGSMLTIAVWPGESRRTIVAARMTKPLLTLTANCYAVGLDALSEQFYVADEPKDGADPTVYLRRSIGWLRQEQPGLGLWFHHDLDIDHGWPLTEGGERTDIPEQKYPRQQVTAELAVPLELTPANVEPGAVYSNALSGWVNQQDQRRASLAAETRPVRLAALDEEALDVLDSAPGPYPIRLDVAGAAAPGGLPEGLAVIDEHRWQVALVPDDRLQQFLAWCGADGRTVSVREASFDERPVYALR